YLKIKGAIFLTESKKQPLNCSVVGFLYPPNVYRTTIVGDSAQRGAILFYLGCSWCATNHGYGISFFIVFFS
ncbi:MAG: hypothetical protein NTX03_07800, partial [Bacteroidetes bacterium]|nr:hypothetical protein [Bacteroidota bacterium]